MAKEYFSHDYNTRSDQKIKDLIKKHGLLGYGVYWSLIEDLYNNANALRMDCESIAYDLRCNSEVVKSVINDFKLFVISGDNFSSISVQRRLDERKEKSEKTRKSANSRWGKSDSDANAMQSQCEGNAIKESKVKKKKVKERSIKQFTPPSLEEFKNYFSEHGYKTSVAERAFKGYAAADWHDSQGKPVRSWKQKCQNVWFKDENRVEVRKFVG